MIALSLEKNNKLKLINKKIKTNLLPYECRVKISFSGICASDIPRAFNSMAYKYPLIMGHEFIGEIIKVGKKVINFEKGDIVSAFPLIPCSQHNDKSCEYCEKKKYNLCDNYDYYGSRRDGSFSEILDVNSWNLFRLNSKKNLKLNTLLEPTAVTFNLFNNLKNNLNNKSKILVLGAGYIGQIISRIIYKHLNAKNIFVIDRNQFKLDFLKKYSCSQLLFFRDENKNSNIYKKLNSKFDIVIETTGGNINFLNAINFVNKNGLILYTGNINKDLLLKKNEVSNILRKEVTIKGIWNSTFKIKNNNWNQAKNFLMSNFYLEELITHTSDLAVANDLLKNINLMKKGKLKNNYIKGLIKI